MWFQNDNGHDKGNIIPAKGGGISLFHHNRLALAADLQNVSA